MFKVTAKATPESFAYLKRLGGDFERSVEYAAQKIVPKVKDIVRKEYPMSGLRRITGRLQDSITAGIQTRGRGKQIWVGSDVYYAPYHERGTYKMRARPFLKPPLERNKAKIADEFENAIYEYLNRRRNA